jgi:rhodanese-related sulfurtransferase
MRIRLLTLLICLSALPTFAQPPAEAIPSARIDQVREQSGAFVLDVREPAEIEKTGSLPGSINIPIGQLADRLSELPHDREILVT